MSNLTVSCPSCGFARQIPYDKVPEGPRKVTCPKCQETFIYTKPDEAPAAAPRSKAPIPAETAAVPQPGQATLAASESSQNPSAGPRLRPAAPVMTDIGELFQESWALFKSRFVTLIGLCLLGIAGFIVPVLLSGALASMTTVGGATFVSLIAVGVLGGNSLRILVLWRIPLCGG
ncbi:MAG: zinc-ribbon domain-containing protein [Geobacteraceae bacterium]